MRFTLLLGTGLLCFSQCAFSLTEVARLETEIPSASSFTISGTFPITPGSFTKAQRDSGQSPYSIQVGSTVIPAQVNEVSYDSERKADVVEIVATVPSIGAVGSRVQYSVVDQANQQPAFPQNATINSIIVQGPASIPQSIKSLVNGPNKVTLVYEDVFGNMIETDILSGPAKVFAFGNEDIDGRTYNRIVPPPGMVVGPPSGALPNYGGVAAYFKASRDEVLQLDLRLDNSGAGLGANNQAQHDFYLKSIMLKVPVGYSVTSFLADPNFHPTPDQQGGYNVYYLAKPRLDGKPFLFRSFREIIRTLAIHPSNQTAQTKALSLLKLEGLAFAVKGANLNSFFEFGLGAGLGGFSATGFVIPDVSYATGGLGGMRNYFTSELNKSVTRWTQGTCIPNSSGVCGFPYNDDSLGLANMVKGGLYGGVTGGWEIYALAGATVAASASREGALEFLASHMMMDNRQPVFYDQNGEQPRPADYLQPATCAPFVAKVDFFNGPVTTGTSGATLGIASAPQFQKNYVLSNGLESAEDTKFKQYQAIDFQHWIRWLRNPLALTWITNRSLAKDALMTARALNEFQHRAVPFECSGNSIHWGQGYIYTPTAGTGHAAFGRNFAWGTLGSAAGMAVDGDVVSRSKSDNWVNHVANVVDTAMIDCLGVFFVNVNKLTNNTARALQSWEQDYSINALRAVLVRMAKNHLPTAATKIRRVLKKSNMYLLDVSSAWNRNWKDSTKAIVVSALDNPATPNINESHTIWCNRDQVPAQYQSYIWNNGVNGGWWMLNSAYAHLQSGYPEYLLAAKENATKYSSSQATLQGRLTSKQSPYDVNLLNSSSNAELLACIQQGLCVEP